MKSISVFCAILGFSISSHAQASWVWQNPLPQGNSLRSVSFFGPDYGWAVGDFGTIINTEDAGATWNIQSSNTKSALYSVHFIDYSTGYSTGANGTILKTTDAGINWVSQTSNTTQVLISIRFPSPNIGYAVGGNGIILKTTNGGSSWTNQTSGTIKALRSVSFVDSNLGFAVGDSGTILKTTNGGTLWTRQVSVPVINLNWVQFVNDSTGWAAGNTTIFNTTDAGNSWQVQYSSPYLRLSSFNFADADTGFATTTSVGDIIATTYNLRTTNGGATWTSPMSLGEYNYPTSTHFVDAQNGYLVGLYGLIKKTANGGTGWSTLSKGTNLIGGLSSVHFVDTNIGFAIGIQPLTDVLTTSLLRTDNGGLNWTIRATNLSYLMKAIDFADTRIGYGVGTGIVKTVNGGSTWTSQSAGNLNALDVVDTNKVWVVGTSGTILHTNDGGLSWNPQASGTTQSLSSVTFRNDSLGWIAGGAGTILNTTNGGANWNLQSSGTIRNLWSIHFANDSTGYAVGDSGVIVKTTNGGTAWSVQPSGTKQRLNAVKFVNANVGYVAGNSGTILETIDGGTTWFTEPSGTSAALLSLSFPDSTHGWVVGGNTILHTAPLLPPTNLTYSQDSVLYTWCYTIPNNTPSVSGTVTTYSVTPALPQGLALNPITGVISGTPSGRGFSDSNYTVTASNAAGSTAVILNIKVVETAADIFNPSLTYSLNPAVYKIGTTIAPNIPRFIGLCSPTGYTINPALPMGLIMNSSTGVISGTPTVKVAASNYSVTVSTLSPFLTALLNITVNDSVTGISPVTPKSPLIWFSRNSITFLLPPDAKSAQLSIADIWGRRVWKGYMEPGKGELTWNGDGQTGKSLSAGIYFVQVKMLDAQGKLTIAERQFVYSP